MLQLEEVSALLGEFRAQEFVLPEPTTTIVASSGCCASMRRIRGVQRLK